MRKYIFKSFKFNEPIDMIYLAANGKVTKRRIVVLHINNNKNSFQAFCHLRKDKRTFRIECILAIVPVILKESFVV